ncbi:MAG: hypothetical protein HKP61_20330 [Dactylosporangium sp.]|nr:hypothetical protein [Dactylosporangium sp.]NNJ63232.1 hypothetical protein [Dactylosporangium sp.]
MRIPASVVPMPAAAHGSPRGRRVMVGVPGLGWRGDLRGDSPVVQGSRTYVPVLPEIEWYRAEAERVEVFAPLVPIDRVWVESIEHSPDGPPSSIDLISRLVSLDTPAKRTPVAARDSINLTGKRLIQTPAANETLPSDRRDLRAVTEPYTSADGDICVRVSGELDWYRWAWSGQAPRTLKVPIHLLWVE